MKLRNLKKAALTLAAIIGTNLTVFAASTYTDVPENHWAYSSIIKVADKGVMVGSSSNYYPNQIIDMMEAARILARVKGYNATSNYNPSNSTLTTINMFKKSFPQKWGTITKDCENCISYLYENQILTISDLDKFITKDSKGTEILNNLKREDMATFLVRVMDKKAEATSYKGDYKFSDDLSISEIAKPYIYYLKSLGVVSGDANGNFNPSSSITKAEMAIFLDKAIYSKGTIDVQINNLNNAPATAKVAASTTKTTTPQNINITSDEGKISSVYASTKVIGITNTNNQPKAYRLASNVKVYLDGFATTIDKLTANMPVVVILMNNEVTEIRAQKITVPVNGQVGTNTNNNGITNNPSGTVTPIIDNSQLITRVCTVSATGTLNNNKTITVIVQMLNPSGDIYKEEQTFILANNCTIKRGTKDVNLTNIEKNDIVTLKINGNNVYSIYVEEKNMTIKGAELVDKRINDENVPIITIKTKEGTKYELKVTSTSDLRRKGEGKVKWQELKIGDTVEVDKEYNVITYLYAEGYTSDIEGTVEEMVISDNSSITIKDSYGQKTKYSVNNANDLYSLTLDSKVKLILDSKEVDSIRLLSSTSTTNSIQGYIEKVLYDSMYVYTNNKSSIKVTISPSTTIYDAVNSKAASVSQLKTNMYVNVVFTNNSDKVAKTISIVSY